MTSSPFDDIKALIAALPQAGPQTVEADPALGRLGRIQAWLSRWRGPGPLSIRRPIVALYAGGHAGTPPEAARERLERIASGGAVVNALAQAGGAGLEAFDLALDRPVGDIALRAALSERDCAATMAFGMEALAKQPDLLILGSIGAGSEAANAAMVAALYGEADSDRAEADTGRVRQALGRLRGEAGASPQPLEILRHLGGRETAAMVGAILAARNQGVPVLLDGYSAAVAAALLAAIDPALIAHVRPGDVSPEPGHRRLLERLGLEPVVELGLSIGEGAGGAAALAVVRLACDLV